MAAQDRIETADRKYYPFTTNNPFDPWYVRITKTLFGETDIEYNRRLSLLKNNAGEAAYTAVKVKNTTVGIGNSNPIATPLTPLHNMETAAKLASIPPTPTVPVREIAIPILPDGDLQQVWAVENQAKLKTVVTEQRLLDKVRELIPSSEDGKIARNSTALLAEEAEAFKDVVSANSPSGSEGSGQATPVQQSGDVRSASPTVVGSPATATPTPLPIEAASLPAPVEATSNLRDAADMLPDEVVTEKKYRSKPVIAGHSYAQAAQASASQEVTQPFKLPIP